MIYYSGMILYDEEGSSENVQDNDALISAIQSLEESISRLTTDLESAVEVTQEVTTEEVTEEITTEEIPIEEMPLQKKDMDNLVESVDKLGESVDSLVMMERENQDRNSTETEVGLKVLDETVDTHLYLTSQVENATINDVYTIGLSIRNVLVLALLLGLSLFFFKLVRTGLERMLNR